MSSLSSTVLSILNIAGGSRWAGGRLLRAIVMMLLRFTPNTHTHGCFCCTDETDKERTDAERFNRDLRLEDLICSLNESKL